MHGFACSGWPERCQIACVASPASLSVASSPPVSTVGWCVASDGLPSSAARFALRAACGDGGAEPSLCVGEVVPGGPTLSGGRGDEMLQGGVLAGVVGVVVV